MTPHVPFMSHWRRSARRVLYVTPSVLPIRELRHIADPCSPPFFVMLLTTTQITKNHCVTSFASCRFMCQSHYVFVFCRENYYLKDGDALDGRWDLYPLGRHARVKIPVNQLDPHTTCKIQAAFSWGNILVLGTTYEKTSHP